jgi:hypothetical protein
MIALVLSVIFSSIKSAFILYVFGSISAKTSLAPLTATASPVAKKVNGSLPKNDRTVINLDTKKYLEELKREEELKR